MVDFISFYNTEMNDFIDANFIILHTIYLFKHQYLHPDDFAEAGSHYQNVQNENLRPIFALRLDYKIILQLKICCTVFPECF